MANTPNLNLVKPGLDDDALITDINNNMDKIDTGFGSLSDQVGKYDPSDDDAISNCNTILTTGRYKTVNSTTNTPYASHFAIDVIKFNSAEISQVAKEVYSSRMFARGTSDGGSTWTDWKEFATNNVETNTSFSSEGLRAYKFGRTVMVTFETYTATSAHAIDTTFATLPAGWRPIMQVSFVDPLSPDRRIVIQSGTGYIQAKKAIASGESVRGYATFISDS